jgi:hypothetical protein
MASGAQPKTYRDTVEIASLGKHLKLDAPPGDALVSRH